MEHSPELEAVTRRLFDAVNTGDTATFLNLHAADGDVVFIGTDPDEWYGSIEAFAPVFEAQIAEYALAGAHFDLEAIDAWTEGTVGWVAGRVAVSVPDEASVAMRWSGVVRLDRGQWRYVHWHSSLGVANEEAIGVELTTTVETIAATVQKERPDLGAATASDGTVTIMFSDMENSTQAAVRMGDRLWLEVLRRHTGAVEEAVADHGGMVVQFLGDGHMLAFPSATQALHCAIAMQQGMESAADGTPIRLRIGVHTGEPIREADQFFGESVIIAARVSALAQGAEILASELVVQLTRPSAKFDFDEPRTVELKGIGGIHLVYPVSWHPA